MIRSRLIRSIDVLRLRQQPKEDLYGKYIRPLKCRSHVKVRFCPREHSLSHENINNLCFPSGHGISVSRTLATELNHSMFAIYLVVGAVRLCGIHIPSEADMPSGLFLLSIEPCDVVHVITLGYETITSFHDPAMIPLLLRGYHAHRHQSASSLVRQEAIQL